MTRRNEVIITQEQGRPQSLQERYQINDKKNIAVLCGGWSEERLISLKSGDSVYKCLKENGYEVSKIDVKTAMKHLIRSYILSSI